MANNRIFLCYRPSGRIIMLGKRLIGGYYQSPGKKDFERFFDGCEMDYIEKKCNKEDDMDDFILLDEMKDDFQYATLEGKRGENFIVPLIET